jgi:hypothetical protein
MIDRNTNVQITDEALAFAKPMLVAVKYNLVVCFDLKETIDLVNEAIKEGYLPVGGLIYAEGKYIQTIVSN